jgi:uncharacterized protein YjiS (DUF1127 family)
MLTTAPIHKPSFLRALEGLLDLHPASAFTGWRTCAAQRRGDDALDRMSLPLLDDMGLLSGDVCSTDRGLVELAMRARERWS